LFKVASVRTGSPAAAAGFQTGDVIKTFGGARFTADNFLKVLARHKPGDRVQVSLQRNQAPLMLTVILAEPAVFDYRIEPMPNASAEAMAMRNAWLSGRN
jgi:predicted metalloprotease with PDZ domain